MKNLKKFIPPVKKPRLSGWLLTSVLLLGTIGLVMPLQSMLTHSLWRRDIASPCAGSLLGVNNDN